VDNIKRRVNDGGEDEIQIQKVTVPVDPGAWRDLKVYCAHRGLKLTDKAGTIIKEWVEANVT